MEPRKTLPKQLRFEVFKRDSFKCQYCGATAPDVLLHVDHILAVAQGGADDVTNLVTACEACNLGKSDVPLDEQAAVSKSRRQMEALQGRREQLEMLMSWREGLLTLKEDTVDWLCRYWSRHTPGWLVADAGKLRLKKLMQKFTLEQITEGMDVAAEQYIEMGEDGKCTEKSWDEAFSKIAGICRVTQAEKKDLGLRELYYIRGILRKRLSSYYDDVRAMQELEYARSSGVPMDALRNLAKNVGYWSEFTAEIDALVDRLKPSGAK